MIRMFNWEEFDKELVEIVMFKIGLTGSWKIVLRIL